VPGNEKHIDLLHDKSTFIRNTVTLRLCERSFIRTYTLFIV